MCVCYREGEEAESGGGVYVLRVGESDVTTLWLELFNAGEDAHDTTITITLPTHSQLSYLGTDSLVRNILETKAVMSTRILTPAAHVITL